MNTTEAVLCYTCQTSAGFNSTEQRGFLLLVVFMLIILVVCYGSVIWFSCRSRFIPDVKSNAIVDDSMRQNEVFDNEEEEEEEYMETMDNTKGSSATAEDFRLDVIRS